MGRSTTTTTESVYIGRPSYWGNPFRIGADGNRKEVIEMFKSFFYNNKEMMRRAIIELTGKELCCHCKKNVPCHGDILRDYINRHNNMIYWAEL